MKPDTLQLMKQKGTYLTPTLMASEWVMGKISQYPPAIQARESGDRGALGDVSQRGQDWSEDLVRDRRGRLSARMNAKEFALMVGLGMKPIDALLSATSVDAELFGVANKLGTLEKESSPM